MTSRPCGRRALYIAAKAPRPGFAKTRLGNAVGHDVAISLYRAFLCDIGARFEHAPFDVGWYVTPPDAWVELQPIVVANGRAPRVLAQGPGDWTERQRDLFRSAAMRGEGRVVLIGSDSPHVTVGLIEEAFDRLERNDVVLGPVYDGGYYLIGMRGWHDVLHGVRMSTTSVYEDVIASCRLLDVSLGTVARTFDVDDADDLQHLLDVVERRDDMPATRAALRSLGGRLELAGVRRDRA